MKYRNRANISSTMSTPSSCSNPQESVMRDVSLSNDDGGSPDRLDISPQAQHDDDGNDHFQIKDAAASSKSKRANKSKLLNIQDVLPDAVKEKKKVRASRPKQSLPPPPVSWKTKLGKQRSSDKKAKHIPVIESGGQQEIDDATDHSESNKDPSLQPILFCNTTARLVTSEGQSGSIESAAVVSVNDTTFNSGDSSIPVAKPMLLADNVKQKWNRRTWLLIFVMLFITLAAIVTGVVVGVTKRSRSTKSTPSLERQALTPPPSLLPSYLRTIAPSTSPSVMQSSTSPTNSLGSTSPPVMLASSTSPTISLGSFVPSSSMKPSINIHVGIKPH